VREADIGAERSGRQETGEEETGKAKRFHGGPRAQKRAYLRGKIFSGTSLQGAREEERKKLNGADDRS
jgi:hypothetical protein